MAGYIANGVFVDSDPGHVMAEFARSCRTTMSDLQVVRGTDTALGAVCMLEKQVGSQGVDPQWAPVVGNAEMPRRHSINIALSVLLLSSTAACFCACISTGDGKPAKPLLSTQPV